MDTTAPIVEFNSTAHTSPLHPAAFVLSRVRSEMVSGALLNSALFHKW